MYVLFIENKGGKADLEYLWLFYYLWVLHKNCSQDEIIKKVEKKK